MESDKFDLVVVTEGFRNSLEQEDDVLMDFYLLAFREILKFVIFCLPTIRNIYLKYLTGSFS